MDLQFINVSDPSQIKTGRARHLVRSQAMRSYRQKQRQHHQSEQPTPTTGPRKPPRDKALKSAAQQCPSPSPSSRDSLEDEDADEEVTVSGEGLPTRFSALVSASRWETLGFVPRAPSREFVYKVLDHYGPTMGWAFMPLERSRAANPLRSNILPLAIRDRALFHAVLADSSNDLMARQSGDLGGAKEREWSGVFCMRHKLEGIRVINEKLKGGEPEVGDETLVAICHLIGLESFNPAKTREVQFQEVKIHMDGIQTMVALRGGLKTIGLYHYLTHLILWVDHIYAALTSHPPRFSISTILDSSPSTRSPSPPNFEFPPPSSPPSPSLPQNLISPRLELILHHLISICRYLTSIESSSHETDFYTFGIKRTLISDAVLRLDPARLKPLDRAVRSAALLFLLTVLMDMNCEVCRDLVAGLRGELEGLETRELGDGRGAEELGLVESLMLWMLLVGGGASPINSDREWFMDRLSHLGEILIIVKWEDVDARLEEGGWPWRRKYCWRWRMVWRDAVLARKTPGESERVTEVRLQAG